MKIKVHTDFDYRFPSRAMMHCRAWLEPYTVKREVGEHGIALGCAVEVKNSKTLSDHADINSDNGETSDLASDSAVAGSDSDADRGSELLDAGADDTEQ